MDDSISSLALSNYRPPTVTDASSTSSHKTLTSIPNAGGYQIGYTSTAVNKAVYTSRTTNAADNALDDDITPNETEKVSEEVASRPESLANARPSENKYARENYCMLCAEQHCQKCHGHICEKRLHSARVMRHRSLPGNEWLGFPAKIWCSVQLVCDRRRFYREAWFVTRQNLPDERSLVARVCMYVVWLASCFVVVGLAFFSIPFVIIGYLVDDPPRDYYLGGDEKDDTSREIRDVMQENPSAITSPWMSMHPDIVGD